MRAEAVLFLSATPVHLGSRNLFTLLEPAPPGPLPGPRASSRRWSNRTSHLTSALRHVRHPAPRRQRRLAETRRPADLEAAGRTTVGAHRCWAGDPRFHEWLARLRGDGRSPMSTESGKLPAGISRRSHSLAHVMNRTRRRDIGRFTIREPRTRRRSQFTPEQRDLLRRHWSSSAGRACSWSTTRASYG